MNVNYNQVRHWRPGNSSYFHIKNMTTHDGTLSIAKSVTDAPSVTVQYSFNGTNWTTLGTTTTTPLELAVPKHTKVYLRANANAWANADGYNTITMDVEHRVSGNIMSLLAGSSFAGTETTISTARAFQKLFYNDTMLVDASMLRMPATTISQYCYANTFGMCTNLVGAPEIFPALTLAAYCYSGTFAGCSSLVTAPELPATTLQPFCYAGMFSGCTSLGRIVANFEAWPANSDSSDTDYHATWNWTQHMKADGLFKIDNAVLPETKNAAGNQTDAHYIPYNWTVVKLSYRYIPFYIEDVSGQASTLSIRNTDATNIEYSLDGTTWTSTNPGVPANGKVYVRANATQWQNNSISSENSYAIGGNIMSLIHAADFNDGNHDELPTGTVYNFSEMFSDDGNIVSSANLVIPCTTMPEGALKFMFYNCTNMVTTLEELPATTIGEVSYSETFQGCSLLTNAPAIAAVNCPRNSMQLMFTGCSSLTTAPAIHLTSTPEFEGMRFFFQDCSSLTSITIDVPSWYNDAMNAWVDGVAASGTFTKPAALTIPMGTSGIPSGWTVVNV